MMPTPSRKRRKFLTPSALAFLVLAAIFVLALVATHLHAAHIAHDATAHVPVPHGREVKLSSGASVHVVFCTDDTDLRALLVAIKTARAASSNPARLVFHIVTNAQSVPLFKTLLSSYARGTVLEFHHNEGLQTRLAAMASSKGDAQSAFKVFQFFLDELLDLHTLQGGRVLYLDTDVVVRGDLAEIYDMNLRGQPVAASKDCTWRFEGVFNLKEVAKFDKKMREPNECIIRSGVQLLDLPVWKSRKLGQKVEKWLLRSRDAEDVLWYEGFVQPAWNLAVSGDYVEIEGESVELRKFGFDHQALLYDLSLAMGRRTGAIKPYVSMCASEAKLLHFSGPLKPSVAETWMSKSVAPMCLVPESFRPPSPNELEKVTAIVDRKFRFRRCIELWQVQLTDRERCALKDLEKEWIDEERAFYEAYKKSLAAQEEAEKEKRKATQTSADQKRILDKALRKAMGDTLVQGSLADQQMAQEIDNIAGVSDVEVRI